MRRILSYIICGVFLLAMAGPVGAIEKKGKVKPNKVQVKAKKAPAPKKKSPTQGNRVSKKKYDNFVDKNGNGIDDRKEKLKPKKDTKKASASKAKPAKTKK